MANFVYIASTIDGFIADKDGGLAWLNELPNPEHSDYGFSAFLDSIDAIIMGRNTFETVLSFGEWPYPKKVFVLSHSLEKVPADLRDRVELVQGDLRAILAKLQKDGFNKLYIDGGRTIQSFLQADLIDEMIITRAAVLLGAGIPLFAEIAQPLQFQVLETKLINAHLVQTHYKR